MYILNMKNSKFIIDKFAKLIEQGLVSSKDLTTELFNILKSKRDEFVFKMKLTSKDEFEVLSKRVENLENKINKLEKIKNNSFTQEKYKSSMNIMYKYEFDRKILEQIDVCENRVLFLKKELLRSKNKLGQMISQKKLIQEKLKLKVHLNVFS